MRHTSDAVALDLLILAILRFEDNIVLVQQQLGDGLPPTWVIPGGLVEAGELVTEALVREVQEETGVHVEAIGHLAAVMQIDRPVQRVQTIAYFFEVEKWHGELNVHDPDEDGYRPILHFTPQAGWMNDPNGLVYFEGEYHLFYQHLWPRHWGHAVSTDLLHWTHLPIALYPDALGDIWSGSAVVDSHDTSGFFGGDAGLVAIFTHHHETGHSQSLAYSNDRGRTWTKYAANPILVGPIKDSRDPKVFWYGPGNHWVMLLTMGDRLGFFTSPDLKDWTFASAFGENVGISVWECPDMYSLPIAGEPGQRKWVLHGSWLDSAIFSQGKGDSGTRYVLGDFDGKTFTADPGYEQGRPLSYGRDDYAPVTWANVSADRGILLGWMGNWLYADKTPTHPWRGAMTLPRTLTLQRSPEGLRLLQAPVSELQTLRSEPATWTNQQIAPDAAFVFSHIQISDSQNAGNQISGDRNACEIIAELAVGTAAEIGLRLRKQGAPQTAVECDIRYDVASETLSMDRRASGATDFHPRFAGSSEAPLSVKDGAIRLHIILDRCSVEVFGGEGEVYSASLIFPVLDAVSASSEGWEIEAYCTGGDAIVTRLVFYSLAEALPIPDEKPVRPSPQ